MASIVGKANRLLLKRAAITAMVRANQVQQARLASDGPKPWNYIWQPNKEPPKTEAEKIAAAKKYGILPEEYEAFSPDEHFNYGDYPKIQTIGGDQRSGQVDWDFPELKRNFGEPLDIEFLNYMENRISTEERPFTCYESLLHFLGIMAFFWALYLLIPTSAHPHTKKQLPADGVHYTFEPKED